MYAYASVRMSQGPGAVLGGGGALKRGKRERERVAYVFMYITFMHPLHMYLCILLLCIPQTQNVNFTMGVQGFWHLGALLRLSWASLEASWSLMKRFGATGCNNQVRDVARRA